MYQAAPEPEKQSPAPGKLPLLILLVTLVAVAAGALIVRAGAAGTLALVPLLGLLLWTIRRLQQEQARERAGQARARAAEQALRDQVLRFRAVADSSWQLTTEFDLDRLLKRLTEMARQLTGARYAAMGVFDPTGERLVEFIASGMDEATQRAIGPLPTGRGLLGHLAKESGAIRLQDLTQHPASVGFPPNHPPMHSFLGMPIRTHGQLYGRLYLTEKQPTGDEAAEFTEIDEQVITALAAHAGAAIETTFLLGQVQSVEARARLLLESTIEGICGLDREGLYTFINRSGAALLGYPPDELIGREVHQFFRHAKPGDDRVPVEGCPFCATVLCGHAIVKERMTLPRADGTTFLAEYSAHPVLVGSRAVGAVVVFADVTPLVRAEESLRKREEELRQSQKMEAIGQLASGIAHDFNNMLTVIEGYSQMLRSSLPSGSLESSAIEEIQRASERATALTGQLLAFSRKQIVQPRVLDLNDVVGGMDRMLRRLISEQIELATVLSPSPCRVTVDQGQLEQVLLNLAINARDAMPSGGTLTFETATVELGEEDLGAHPNLSPGSYVLLSVSDTGHGMDAATQARIFEPFFTTKEPGKGTGLGLSTVYGVVEQTGGFIGVESAPGQGTTFKIYLPHAGDHAQMAELPALSIQELRGSETILLVEDDEDVRMVGMECLSEFGYTVLDARDGAEALRLSHQHQGPIHLLLTDLVMPGMNGGELARRLAEEHPGTKVLYMSGYADDTTVKLSVLVSEAPFLQKPFTPFSLACKVREVLDVPSPPG